MCRSVTDAATVLSIIAGRDARDNFTLAQPSVVPDYLKALNPQGLKGKTIGIPRTLFSGTNPVVISAFNASVEIIRKLGATIVDPADLLDEAMFRISHNSTIVLDTDFKVCCASRTDSPVHADKHTRWQVDVANYMSELLEIPTGVHTLADLIAFNTAHASEELVPPFWTDQSTYVSVMLATEFP